MFRFASVVLLGLVAFTEPASAIGIRCDFCSAETMKQRASVAGNDTHDVYSVPDAKVRTYLVDIEPGRKTVRLISTDSEVQSAVNGLSEIYHATGGTMKLRAEVSIQELGFGGAGYTAFNVVNDANLRARISDRLADGSVPSLSAGVNALLTLAASHFGFAGTQMSYVVVFYDGSKVVFEYEVGSAVSTYIQGSARTGEGHLIPEANSGDYAGLWGSGELAPIVDQLELLGATMNHVGSGSLISYVSCTFDGRTLTCKVSWISR